MRLIDADDLRETLLASKYIGAGAGIFLQNLEIDRCIEAIDNAPTVDTDIVPLMQDIVANMPEIVDKAVKLYIEERRRENEVN